MNNKESVPFPPSSMWNQEFMGDSSIIDESASNQIIFCIGQNKVVMKSNDDNEICFEFEGEASESAKVFLDSVAVYANSQGYGFGEVILRGHGGVYEQK